MELIWVTKAKYINNKNIYIEFNDGLSGTVNLGGKLKGPIFEPLKNDDFFKKFQLNSWTIFWENGADFAPEFLYNLVVNAQDKRKLTATIQ